MNNEYEDEELSDELLEAQLACWNAVATGYSVDVNVISFMDGDTQYFVSVNKETMKLRLTRANNLTIDMK